MTRSAASALGLLGLAAALTILRVLLPERPLDSAGPRALADAAFAIGLLLFVLYAARGMGHIILRWNVAPDADASFGLVLAVSLGLGALAYGVMALGLIGILSEAAVAGILAIGSVASIYETFRRGRTWGDPWAPFRSLSAGLKAGLAVAGAVFAMSAVQALTPVWDYDGLMYHLQGPALFLRAGRLELLPNLWQANGPLTAEMLYLIGLAAESEVFSKVVHLAMAALLLLATFAVGRRHLGDRGGWLAAALLLGVPIYSLWGSLAYADMGWALYEFLAVAAYLEWRKSPERGWLIGSGVMLGLAMGSKYPAGGLLPILLLAVGLERAASGRERLRSLLWLGGTALVVASPWYLKNLLWSGNPFYPFLFGGLGWPASRLDMLMAYLQSFGTGGSVLDYLLLPISLFMQRAAFGTFMSRIDVPNPLFLLALAVPFLRVDPRARALGWILLLRFALWAVGTQQTRFLLPLYPMLALLTAAVLEAWIGHPGAIRRRAVVIGLVGGMVAVTLAYQAIYLNSTRPVAVVLGRETKDSFLRRAGTAYDAIRYIHQELEAEDRVLMAWDGQGFRCDLRCLPDAEQSQWVQLVAAARSAQGMTSILAARGITHLLVNLEGMNFMLLHDPTGLHAAAASFLADYATACLRVEFESEKVILYRLECG